MALEKTNRHSLFPLLRRKTLFRPLVESLEPRLALAAFTVDTTADTAAVNLVTGQDSTGHISLRSAIMAANNLGGSNTVALPTGNYNLTIAGTDEDNAATGDLVIKCNLTVTGAGPAASAVNANQIDRAFQVFAGFSLTIAQLTVTGGLVHGADGAEGADGATGQAGGNGGSGLTALGGGIFNSGTLTIVASTITNNQAIGGSGGRGGKAGSAIAPGAAGLAGGAGGSGGSAFGGAIYSEDGSTLTITNTLLSFNQAIAGSAGHGGDASAGVAGTAGAAGMSGIGGTAGDPGGPGGNGGTGGAGGNGGSAHGGGIYTTGDTTIVGSTISNNVATASNGNANGAPGAGGAGGPGGTGGAGGVDGGGPGGAGGHGGNAGTANGAGTGGPAAGGGIASEGTLTLRNATIYGNEVRGGSSAVTSLSSAPGGVGGPGGQGGFGIPTTDGQFPGPGGRGGDGGIGATAGSSSFSSFGGFGGGATVSASALVESCTITANNAAGTPGATGWILPGSGGAAGGGGPPGGTGGATGTNGQKGPDGTASSTFDPPHGTGGGIFGNPQMRNSIVAANLAFTTPDGGSPSLGHNFIGGEPQLAILTDNGGPTPTMALLPDSPAIGAGDPALERTFDQRGIRRFAPVDIGATAYYVWHNLQHDVDVNGDGNLAPNDALDVINLLNAKLPVSAIPKDPSTGPRFFDVDNDGFIAPTDVVAVINNINAGVVFSMTGAESEAASSDQAANDLFARLAAEIALQPKRRWQ